MKTRTVIAIFLGTPDHKFPFLKQGYRYILEIIEEPSGLLGWIMGKKHPVIINPFVCHYSSWETFHRNWHVI